MVGAEDDGKDGASRVQDESVENTALAHFRELCTDSLPALVAWTRIRIRPELRARVDPDEIIQETCLRALQSLGSFEATRGPFQAWIIGIAKNVLLRALQMAQRDVAKPVGSTTHMSALEAAPDTVTSITRQAARSDAACSLLAQVEALPAEDQMLTMMCGLEGLSVRAAAERLNLSEDATKKRWQRLRAELAQRESLRRLLIG